MNKSLIADIIVSVHFVYMITVVGGLFVIILGCIFKWRFIRNFWFRTAHLGMILVVVFETIFGIPCPLTEWEYDLRIASGQYDAVSGSFIARLIQNIIFYDFPQYVFTIVYCLFGAAVLLTWLLIPPNYPWRRK